MLGIYGLKESKKQETQANTLRPLEVLIEEITKDISLYFISDDFKRDCCSQLENGDNHYVTMRDQSFEITQLVNLLLDAKHGKAC